MTPDAPQDDKDKTAHGGKRDNSGAPTNHTATARSVIEWIESSAMATGGEAWAMTKEEKKNIAQPLADVFKQLAIVKPSNPYGALVIAGMCYAFRPGRASVTTCTGGVWQKLAAWNALRIERKTEKKTAKKK